MTGHKVRIGAADVKVGKDGRKRVQKKITFRDASHAIRAKKSTRSRPVRRVV